MQPLWKTVWRFLKKRKIELSYDPAIPLLGKTTIRKRTYTPVFIATLFTIAKTWKQPKCPLTAVWMDLDIIILREVSQKEKDKYNLYVESKI